VLHHYITELLSARQRTQCANPESRDFIIDDGAWRCFPLLLGKWRSCLLRGD
jgi:hypothetical protein